MKELSIEEKAKRYDIALDKVKMLLGTGSNCSREELEYVFPELAESEDEKIRKELIGFLRNIPNSNYTCEEMALWLEKQGEQKPVVIIPKFRVGDVIRPKGSMAEYTIESISGECYHGKGWGLHISCDDDYELVKQKPVWSEDDEKIYQSIIDDTVQENQLNSEQINWLKDIKYRYFPQPKQEWSEEDKVMLDEIIDFFENGTVKLQHDLSLYASWLKSLKDRYTWKPSEEQMKLLREVQQALLGKDCHNRFVNFMYELKRLREE